MQGSRPFQLNRKDLLAILRGTLLAAGGAAVAFLATEIAPNIDESTTLGALVAGVAATVLNLVRKFISDTQ